MKPLKMSPAVRILLQIAVGAALGFLTGILIMLGIDALPFDEYPFNKLYEVFATHVVIASFYLGTLFGIKTVNSVSGRKQKYTLTLMTVPGFTIATFFFLEWMGEDITPLIQWLLYLVMIPGLVVLVTHLEVFLRKRYKLSRHS